MLPLLAAAGRTLMGAVGRGGAGKAAAGAGPRGANAIQEAGAGKAGKSSPMDMLGNVANVASLGMVGKDMLGGGSDSHTKPKAGAPQSKYETVL